MKEVIPNSAAVRLALSGSRYVDVTAMLGMSRYPASE
jgi:hypothetical protein